MQRMQNVQESFFDLVSTFFIYFHRHLKGTQFIIWVFFLCMLKLIYLHYVKWSGEISDFFFFFFWGTSHVGFNVSLVFWTQVDSAKYARLQLASQCICTSLRLLLVIGSHFPALFANKQWDLSVIKDKRHWVCLFQVVVCCCWSAS